MVYTIGSTWVGIYVFLGFCFFSFSIWRFYAWSNEGNRGFPMGGVIGLVMVVVSIYFAIFAGTHFRVGVNQRALIINTISGRIVGTRDPGVQSKPLLGVTVQQWPANKAYAIVLDLQPGTASATSSDLIALWVDSKLYVDLSQMDLESAYRAVNGDFSVFLTTYLEPQLMNVVRLTSKDFSVDQHSLNKDAWASAFDENATAFFADQTEGYGIVMVPGRTIMSFDFVNQDDANAYDTAHRSSFLKIQRENEQAALNIELAMAKIRGEMLKSTSQGITASWQEVVNYIQTLPPEIQHFLMNYMGFQSQMEYLRLVGQLQPSQVFPPGMTPALVYDTAPTWTVPITSTVTK